MEYVKMAQNHMSVVLFEKIFWRKKEGFWSILALFRDLRNKNAICVCGCVFEAQQAFHAKPQVANAIASAIALRLIALKNPVHL